MAVFSFPIPDTDRKTVLMEEAIVLSDGVIEHQDFLKNFLDSHGGALIICADGAVRHLAALDRVPAVIIGDMDSADPAQVARFRDRGTRILTYPKEKDKTDTHLAIELVIAEGFRTIFLLGALGGRIDHSLANISLLYLGQKRNAEIRIIEPACEIFIITGTETLQGNGGETVSLLPLDGSVRGITLEGFQYPLSDATMEPGNPYGISNRLAKREGKITVREGRLLVIRYFGEVS